MRKSKVPNLRTIQDYIDWAERSVEAYEKRHKQSRHDEDDDLVERVERDRFISTEDQD